MNRRGILFFSVLAVLVVCAGVYGVLTLFPASDTVNSPVVVSPELNASLAEYHTSFLTRTTQIHDKLLSSADALSGIELGDPQLDIILRELYAAVPASVGAGYVQTSGVVGRSSPLASLYTLVDESELKNINATSFAEEPVLFLGPMYSASYGEVVCFAAPIRDRNSTYKGYVCVALYPADLLSETSYPGSRHYNNTTFRPWAVFSDGLILSSPNTVFVGDNVLESSPLHQSAADSPARSILAHADGAVRLTTSGPSADSSDRVAVWTSAEVSGREVRLILSTAEVRSDIPLYPVDPYVTNIYNATRDLYMYAAENGQAKTLAELARPDGIFASEKLRYFAYDFNGTALFDGYTPRYIGENMLNFRDAYGLRMIATDILRARQGGGYVYMYIPLGSETPDEAVLCIYYVLPVNDDWFVAVGQSILDHPVQVDPSKRDVVLRTVQNITSYALIHGKEAALQEITNPDAAYRKDHNSLFAMDYNGTILADSLYPELVGKNAFFFVDMHGASTMREIVMLARAGGGYCYLGVTNSVTQESMICLVYVESMGDDWCIGSSISLDNIPLVGWQKSTGDILPGNVTMTYIPV